MDISKYQETYQKIIDNLKNKYITITKRNAYAIHYQNPDIYYPFPQDAVLYRAYDPEFEGYSNEQLKEFREKSNAELEALKTDTSDRTGDFNIFSLKYYDFNKGTPCFKIPIADVAKNYFLCYQHNIDKFRRGLKAIDSVSQMRLYEILLKQIRDEVVSNLCHAIVEDPDEMTERQLFSNFYGFADGYDSYDLDELHKEAVEARKIIKTLKEHESASPDAKHATSESNYSMFPSLNFQNFSKQMFVDLVETKYNDKPIVKKAVTTYMMAQSDKDLMAQMEQIFNHGEHKELSNMVPEFIFEGIRDLGRDMVK